MTNLPDPPLKGISNNQYPMSNDGNSGQSQSSPSLNTLIQPAQPAAGVHKEVEPVSSSEPATLEETVAEVELEPDMEAAGVQKISETIELPPDMKKMGVQAVGPTQPIPTAATVQLPLSDDQIVVGLHAQIISSLRWLAEWCIRKLKKAHVHLKKMGGGVVREIE